mmetsp:Transcript_25190/g.45350  ORF Transcript_25190/g.45350 Transcript_25190/m.45350 type:complete len:257 (+) Transcript_25190:365-1135(+)
MFLEVGVRAQVETVEGGVGPRDFLSVRSVHAVPDIAEEGANESGVVDRDRNLLKDVAGVDEIVLSRGPKLDNLVREAVALEDEVTMGSLHGIVQYDDGIGTEVGLIRQLIFEEGGRGVCAEVHGLVPSHAVVVHVYLSEHFHHFQLEFVAVQGCGFVVDVRGLIGGFDNVALVVVMRLREGKGVRDFETAVIDHETEEGAGYHRGEGFLTMLYYFEGCEAFQFHGRDGRIGLHYCRHFSIVCCEDCVLSTARTRSV